MKKDVIVKLTKTFEEVAQTIEGVECWMARDLQILFEYTSWENFVNVIEKAKIACQNSKHLKHNHFHDVMKMISLGKGAQKEIPDYKLSRYACYLIAQNGDPRKESIAFAQSYFALQTRKQEFLEKHIGNAEQLQARQKLTQTEKELSSTLYEHGVDDQGFGRIRSKGDQALFGGRTTSEMKGKLGIPGTRALADFLPTITIKAKDFAGEITHFNVKKENLQEENRIRPLSKLVNFWFLKPGFLKTMWVHMAKKIQIWEIKKNNFGDQMKFWKRSIVEEHIKNNQGVRQVLIKSDIYPEELPAEEDIKKLEKQIQKEEEKFIEHPEALPSV